MKQKTSYAITVIAMVLTACGNASTGQASHSQPTTPTPTALEQAIDSMFGCEFTVPKGMTYSRRGVDFIWLSDNEPQTMRNICIYTYPGTRLDAAAIVRKRDSVMQANIAGEEPGMYMHTEEQVAPTTSRITWKGQALLRTTGLWEMEGDAMGGPFVCHSRADTARRRIVVAEAFVFAPGRSKEEVMKRLEAQLLKLSIKPQNKK